MQMTQCGHGLLSNGHHIFRKCILCTLQSIVVFLINYVSIDKGG